MTRVAVYLRLVAWAAAAVVTSWRQDLADRRIRRRHWRRHPLDDEL